MKEVVEGKRKKQNKEKGLEKDVGGYKETKEGGKRAEGEGDVE